MDTTNRILPLNYVARALRVPVRWLREEAQAGRIPCLRAGDRYLANVEEVEAALLERVRHAPSTEEGWP